MQGKAALAGFGAGEPHRDGHASVQAAAARQEGGRQRERAK